MSGEGGELVGDTRFVQANVKSPAGTTKLKPLDKKPEYMVNGDDFWFSSVGDYGKDFGGKNNNEAWQYQSINAGSSSNPQREMNMSRHKKGAKSQLPPLAGSKEQVLWSEKETYEDYAKRSLPVKVDRSPKKPIKGK
eukprot:TRINITY_DN12035_c0_g1_i5.p1 TRINITY_DN12035_c0_g1~~TRINITY_DN12035_c0_g1_i5.p1  ORF type:complete len:137 (-),score=35.35 TRINITY_DN12035_c0_g1_i5:6-416(-)